MASAALAAFAVAVGLLEGVYFAFMALGLNLVFGVVRMVNIAHGDLVMLGGYLALLLYSAFRANGLATFVALFPAFFGVGAAVYYMLVPRLEGSSDPEMFSFVAFFGISMFVEALATLLFGVSPVSLPARAVLAGSVTLFGYGLPKVMVLLAGVSAAMLAATWYYLERTPLGRAARAIMQNREQAAALGVNTRLATLFAFSYGFALAAMAGVFEPYVLGFIYPSFGGVITVMAFTIVIIGALGNPLSSVVGGLIFGVMYAILSAFVPSLAYAITFLVLLAIMIVRPGGLLGGAQREV